MSILLESQESSSPVITKAVSKGLLKEASDIYHFSNLEKIALRFLGYFPKEIAEWLIPRVNKNKSLSQADVANLRTRDLVNVRISDYKQNAGKFPAITIGIGMGGTTAHLALALGGPFLPQAFVMTLKNGTMTGNVNEYLSHTQDTARKITNNNPDLMTIQHYDPIHDDWLVKRTNHLRVKLIDLPEEYKLFIKEKLIPGGDIVYLEGKAQWKRFRTGERNVFQVGGWGGISPEEFLDGSQRISEFAQKQKLKFSSWMLNGYPVEDGPESEWGSEEGLGEALKLFCLQEGFNFVNISFSDPNDFSRLSFSVKKEILRKANIEPNGVVVEMFSQFDTSIVEQSALLPLWLIFNTLDSRDFLLSMVEKFPKNKPIFFSGLSTFSNTPDIVPWCEWEKALEGFSVINIGARKTHYPADTLALLNWKKPLEKWATQNRLVVNSRITGNELLKLAKKTKI